MKSLNPRFGDPSYPFAQFNVDAMDDLEGLFGPDEKIFRDIAKFDNDDVEVNLFERCYDSDDSCSECPYNWFRDMRSHECMWGGQCCNKDFQRSQPPKPRAKVTPRNPIVSISARVTKGKCSDVMVVTNSVKTVPPAIRAEGRSLLLNRTNVQQPQPPPTPQSSRPETPVSLGSEDDLGPIPIDTHNTSIFRSALDHLTTTPTFSGSWESSLFTHDSRTKHEKTVVRSDNDISRMNATASSDHNYGVTSKSFKLQGLGVDTPSDSEEEIDVVSVSERSRSSSCSSALPTRPTATDREHLESLLSASQAVSRKLKRTLAPCPVSVKRRRTDDTDSSDNSDDDSYDNDALKEEYDDDYADDHSEDDSEEEEEVYSFSARMAYGRGRPKKPKGSPIRRKPQTVRFGEESQERRDLHNNMERMRRIDLRNSFEILKDLVPSVSSKDRAAKVVILKEAAAYCGELGAECQSKNMQVMALRKEQERLRATVSSLRRAAAMHR